MHPRLRNVLPNAADRTAASLALRLEKCGPLVRIFFGVLIGGCSILKSLEELTVPKTTGFRLISAIYFVSVITISIISDDTC